MPDIAGRRRSVRETTKAARLRVLSWPSEDAFQPGSCRHDRQRMARRRIARSLPRRSTHPVPTPTHSEVRKFWLQVVFRSQLTEIDLQVYSKCENTIFFQRFEGCVEIPRTTAYKFVREALTTRILNSLEFWYHMLKHFLYERTTATAAAASRDTIPLASNMHRTPQCVHSAERDHPR